MKVLGVIPARRNSKSIRNKNVALLAGKPLVEYTFEAAKGAVWLSRVVCSTDCPQVSALAEAHGIQVIDRPAHLAQDDTPMVPVLQHALSVAGEQFDAVCLLQPTCPLRRACDIDEACCTMEVEDATSVISYVDVGANHPARMSMLLQDTTPYPVWGHELQWANKQDLPQVYIRSGDVYLVRSDVLARGELAGEKPRAYIIPKSRFCNIDDFHDLAWAAYCLGRENPWGAFPLGITRAGTIWPTTMLESDYEVKEPCE